MNSNLSLPKYHQLKEYLCDQMRRGELAPGDQVPSEYTLAKQFKLSRHTVRKALGDLENEGLVYREQGRGTFCSMRSKTENKTIAVMTTYISDYIFPAVIRGIEEILSVAGYTLLLANTDNNKQKEAQCFEKLLNQNIAGLIIEPTKSALENCNLKYFQEIERRRLPYIMFHATYSDLEPAYIMMDDEKGGFMAAQYLLQLGHQDIAGIFKTDDRQGIKRQNGFLAALTEYNIDLKSGYLGNYDTEQISSYPYQFVRGLLQRTDRPTGLICYNDQIAIQAIGAIRDEGLRIPEDISIVGYDDSSLAVASEIKLTTIKHTKTVLGRQVARFIIDMVEGRIERPTLVYQPELIIRSSCQSLR